MFKSRSNHLLVLIHGNAEFNPLSTIVNSQLVCRLPVEILEILIHLPVEILNLLSFVNICYHYP